METTLFMAGLRFRFISELNLDIDPELNNFITSKVPNAEITIRISRDWNSITLPDSPLLGRDMVCCYYQQEETLYCLTRGNSREPLACSVCGHDYQELLCVLNERPFLKPPKNLGSILRMIPIRAIFQHFGVLFLHASRICYKDRAILFSAPSGTGKTTQARLWNKCRSAEILCNDRTLLRKEDSIWHTYGYPLDGSEPVRSNAVIPLGCVVLLAHGASNQVERLKFSRGAALLMSQAVIDVWNPEARKIAMEEILSIMEAVPVYLLVCTPDEQAVGVLEEKLKEDGVISFE